ncbi:MAG TPA: enoyl-CoA hydratase, partial [Cupriavidus sp.]|nr:enoyl-CoA hydratase [Cupriavidus sp.]
MPAGPSTSTCPPQPTMFMTQCQENFMSDPILLTSEQG